jgi:L-asparagine transporter-like permease
MNKEFGSQALGPFGAAFYSLVISASALGSLNATIFATGALFVAASNQGYFPKAFANKHCDSADVEAPLFRARFSVLPNWCQRPALYFIRATSTSRWEKRVPV